MKISTHNFELRIVKKNRIFFVGKFGITHVLQDNNYSTFYYRLIMRRATRIKRRDNGLYG